MRMVERCYSSLVFLATAFACLALFGAGTVAAQSCANPPVASIGPTAPSDVCVPAGFTGNPIAFFDDYSWKVSAALMWPAANNARGQPDAAKTLSDAGPRVFETFKGSWEVFHKDGSAPTPWNTYDASNACSAQLEFGDIVLASFSKFSDLGQAGFGSLVGPLVAQNTTYVRYQTAFNQAEFDQLLSQQLYLRKNLPAAGKSLTFANGSIDVKSAWIDMDKISHPERFYTRSALVMDPATGNCSRKTVGLVGLHIVQKTATRPQWIWTTFEQVDNVASGTPGNTPTFNDGTSKTMPPVNPYKIDPLTLPTPPPFNVVRVKPIHPSTQKTNGDYQSLAAIEQSPLRFYQLVMTQWPTTPSAPSIDGTPAHTFPGAGNDTTAFANTTLETFDQGNIRTGCMNCHNMTRTQTDFLWTLSDHAFPPNVPDLLFKAPAFKGLKELLAAPPIQTSTNQSHP